MARTMDILCHSVVYLKPFTFQSYKLVELDEESEEYLSMAILFHDTMYYPLAEIVSVKRVQNTSLWQFYNV